MNRTVVAKAASASVEMLEERTLLAGSGLAGAYFARTNFTATKFSRVDSTIDFQWNGGTPAASLGTDGFSVRWSGSVLAHFSEIHTFIATVASGGLKLWVNGQLIINDWDSNSQRQATGDIRLLAGHRYDVRMDYWSDGNNPVAKLEWQGTRQAREVVPVNRLYPAVLDSAAPSAPPHLRAINATDSTVSLSWDNSSDPSGIVTYDIYFGSHKVSSTDPGETSYVRLGLQPQTGYTFSVQAIDPAGNVSKMSTTAATTSAPTLSAPSVPQDLHVSGVSSDAISLSWSAATDIDGVITGYRIYRNGVKLNVAPTGTSFTDTGLAGSTKYTYMVRSADDSGLFSGYSDPASATTNKANIPPTTPTNLHATDIGSDFISLSWSASTDPDGVVTDYRVYRNGVKLNAMPTGTSFTDTGLNSGTTYSYMIRAADNGGAFSGFSDALQVTTIIPTPPPTRDAFSVINASDHDDASGVTSSGTDLNSLDDGDFVRYRNVDFGGGANSVKLNLAQPSSNRGGRIELHLDGVNGQQVGLLNIQPTGSWSTFHVEQVNIAPVSGMHDLYLVFKGRSDMASLRSIQFNTAHLTRIMALGDSITQQDTASPSYRYYLWHKLIDAGQTNIDFVGGQTQAWTSSGALADPPNFDFDQNHEGHAGWRADQVADAVAGWASVNTPDIVLLHIGTNDFIDGQDVSSTLSDVGRIISNLRSVNPNVKVLVAQIIPDFADSAVNDKINQYNFQLPGFVQGLSTAQSPLTTVDLNSGMTVSDTQEGIHPNSTGDSKMADRWYTALAPLL